MRNLLSATLPLLVLAAACGDGGGGPSEHTLELIKWTPSGDLQVDTVGQLLPKPVRVRVLVDGQPSAGHVVHFAGGTLGTIDGTTDGTGVTTSTWTLGTAVGEQSVTASLDGATGSPLTFTATALPDAPDTMFAVSGAGQAAEPSDVFPQPFGVRVTDQYGNAVPGVWVQFAASGALTLNTDSAVTLETGVAQVAGIAKAFAGSTTVTASVSGINGSPVEFTGAVVSSYTTIHVDDTGFSPDSVTINAGDAVKFVVDAGTHNIVSLGDPSFPGSGTISAGASYGLLLFSTAGAYHYACSLHEGHQGVIVVQ